MDETVGALGEARVLRRILSLLGPSAAELGPGDDAAVLAAPGGRIVATTDTLVHGPDFRLAWSSGYDLGWKAAAVNLADVAAMGATPTALLVALAMPDDTPVAFVEELSRGLRAACAVLAPDCGIEGGDLAASATLTIAVTALGVLPGAPVTRAGARPGDTVAVAGELGVAARGLHVLFDRFRDSSGTPLAVTPDAAAGLDAADAHALAMQLRPEPPVQLGVLAASAGATAMMDVSDGLVIDARRLAAASGVTIAFERAKVGDGRFAFDGGEDHSLLATFPAGAPLPAGFRAIGTVKAPGEARVIVDGEAYTARGGWDPYADWDAAIG